jgi:hypothetical protein
MIKLSKLSICVILTQISKKKFIHLIFFNSFSFYLWKIEIEIEITKKIKINKKQKINF